MEQKLELIIKMIKNQDQKIDSLNEKYDSLKGEMNSKYDNLASNQNRIEEKLDNLSNQVTALESYAHEKCEAALDGWASHLQIQEEIKNNVTTLNSKIENHEMRISVLEGTLEV